MQDDSVLPSPFMLRALAAFNQGANVLEEHRGQGIYDRKKGRLPPIQFALVLTFAAATLTAELQRVSMVSKLLKTDDNLIDGQLNLRFSTSKF